MVSHRTLSHSHDDVRRMALMAQRQARMAESSRGGRCQEVIALYPPWTTCTVVVGNGLPEGLDNRLIELYFRRSHREVVDILASKSQNS